jgi:hypothetical protein
MTPISRKQNTPHKDETTKNTIQRQDNKIHHTKDDKSIQTNMLKSHLFIITRKEKQFGVVISWQKLILNHISSIN